jgi:methyltransferase (TIGR00027 family)
MSAAPINATPDETAVRVALWRALHKRVDAPPHIIDDDIGLRLAHPADDWRDRPDMHPESTRLFRASIVARARFVDDLVLEQAGNGIDQYVILGAGLDSFAQRRTDIGATMRIFEIDRPATQAWKQQRLREIGFDIPSWLRFVPVDFESDSHWWTRLSEAGFAATRPAVIASTGVAMYLTKEAVAATLREIARFAPGSVMAMTFLLPPEMAEQAERAAREAARQGARARGTPFLSFFEPDEIVAMAREAGLTQARYLPASVLAERYFADRTDDLRLPRSEAWLIAST